MYIFRTLEAILLILFLLFAVLPISEIMLLMSVSDGIGGWNTFFLVLVTAFFGAYFVKREGLSTLQTVQAKTAAGEMPGKELSEGILLLIAGVLLVTPGFITDGIGLLFTLPFSRAMIAASVVKHFMHRQQQTGSSGFYFNMHGTGNRSQHDTANAESFNANGQQNSDGSQGTVFDGEYVDKTDNDNKPRLE